MEVVRKPTLEGGTYAERIAREKGAELAGPPDVDYLDVNDMLGWLQRETFAVSKEAELRIRDATAIVTEFAGGQISQKEANERMFRYDERWSAALDGMHNPERMTDDHILSELDRHMASYRQEEFASERKVVNRRPPKARTHQERVGRKGASRAESLNVDKDRFRTADEMLKWLKEEVYAVSKEAELRLRDVTAIVTDYATGQISQREANGRMFFYDERWSEALDGMHNPDRMTDDQILSELDRCMASYRQQFSGSGKPPSR